MAGPTFDPKHAVRFDLSRGAAMDMTDARQLVVPAAAVQALLQDAGRKAAATFGAAIGKACGTRAAKGLGGGDGVQKASLDAVITHLAGQLAIAGIGIVSLERWGRAMVFLIENAAVEDEALLAAVVEGAVGAASGRTAHAVSLGRAGTIVRVLVASERAATRARELLAKGISWGDVLSQLQDGGAA